MLMTRASHANLETPIIGDSSTMRAACGSPDPSITSSAYFSTSAPPFEYPTSTSGLSAPIRVRRSRAAMRTAASQSSQVTSVRPAGTVPCPGTRSATTWYPSPRRSSPMLRML